MASKRPKLPATMDAGDQLSEEELSEVSGGNPIPGVIGAVATATGLGGLGGEVKDMVRTIEDTVSGAVQSVGSQIMSKRKGK